MPKYYVSTGDFHQIIDRPDPTTAVYDAFARLEEASPSKLGLITIASERGFDSLDDDDFCFNTLDILEDTDQLKNYKLEDWL